ncbi:tRNA lysidine(34) synthetase TilS [Pleomorphovibrio marinus]|uniref:tRNA lysidine(34) synthetase TilS n=1 Tax=Pleomorphovibrio marinus TaxID=2164132 RepID=UPI000E0CB7A4|nr:tRNA lysidine(34) synthetase TilS [Pleomorphovibrio marinus]
MLNEFSEHTRSTGLLHPDKYYLHAISGGIDSVCLAHLLKRCGFQFGLAHCNFQLRGSESDKDEGFVRDLAQSLGVEVLVKRFETITYKKEEGLSTQMAARELRYSWFEELLQNQVCKGVIVAHHADDQVETILLNLLRGSGIEGLYGMAEHRQGIIRPFLPFDRVSIQAYMEKEGLGWREDPTNAQSDYKRNFLRNEVFPVLQKFQPDAASQLLGSFGRIKDTGKAFFHFFEDWKSRSILQEGEYQSLPFTEFRYLPGRASLLFYWLRQYGINFPQVEEILRAVDAGTDSGKCFPGREFVLNLNREELILGPLVKEEAELEIWPHDIEAHIRGIHYDIFHLDKPNPIDKNSRHAMLDKDLLDYPLIVRKWKEGDKFRPLGMKQFKKISDFLIDLKIPVLKKKEVQVLCSGKNIAWVIGQRIDDRFAVSVSTKRTLYFKQK